MLGFRPDGSLAMFPKLVHNPGFLGLDQEQIIAQLGPLGLWVLKAEGEQGNVLETAQMIRNQLGFDTQDPNTRVHVPKTQKETEIVLHALIQQPSVQQLARYILTIPFSDLR